LHDLFGSVVFDRALPRKVNSQADGQVGKQVTPFQPAPANKQAAIPDNNRISRSLPALRRLF
jgi:hypothetical protein